MASNVVSVDTYKIGSRPYGTYQRIAFPTTGCLLQDCSESPQRVVSGNISVYSSITYQDEVYYAKQTLADLVTLFNA
jgi:hypothetical protein